MVLFSIVFSIVFVNKNLWLYMALYRLFCYPTTPIVYNEKTNKKMGESFGFLDNETNDKLLYAFFFVELLVFLLHGGVESNCSCCNCYLVGSRKLLLLVLLPYHGVIVVVIVNVVVSVVAFVVVVIVVIVVIVVG